MKPLFSVIIPTFNREAMLRQALESLIAQRFQEWEAIVVDDGSTDDSFEKVQAWAANEPRIRFFKRDCNPKSASTCRNLGAQKAEGSYLVFMDSDDVFLFNAFENRCKGVTNHPNADLVVFPSAYFQKTPGDTKRLWNVLHKDGPSDVSRFFNGDQPWHTSGPVWKKDAFFRLGMFTDWAVSGQDWEVHVRALLAGLRVHKVSDLEENLHHFIRRDEQESITSDFVNQEKIKNRFQQYEHIGELMRSSERKNWPDIRAIAGFFYRYAEDAAKRGLKKEAQELFHLIPEYNLLPKRLYKLLNWRLKGATQNKKFMLRIADMLLHRMYNIQNIDNLVNSTKGTTWYPESKFSAS